jgi:Ni/Fe-hydrogenase subunit HybB-like protein
MNEEPRAVGGRIFTRPFKVLAGVFALFVLVLAWRFYKGIGAVSALNDGYPWGIWIAYDVVSGTALACGGYAVALLCYVLNKGKYHAMVRPAILTSALGYTLAGFAVFFDVGRYWNIWKVPLLWNWNRNSILLEVAMCITAYTMVLWIELSPVFVERWRDSRSPLLRSISQRLSPILKRVLLWFMALGILLPTMHHSSLGALMLIAVNKVNQLWYTPLLPLLFLVSSIAMGYAVVVAESALSSVAFGRERETEMLTSLSTVMIGVLGGFLGMRLVDLISRQRIGLAFAVDFYAAFFWLEMALFGTAAALLIPKASRRDPGRQFFAALLMMLGGTLYRFDVFLVGFNPGRQWSYFPSVAEMILTMGLIAVELMAYMAIVKRFPVIGGAMRPRRAPAPALRESYVAYHN